MEEQASSVETTESFTGLAAGDPAPHTWGQAIRDLNGWHLMGVRNNGVVIHRSPRAQSCNHRADQTSVLCGRQIFNCRADVG